ncbi:MAG: DUF262 domain-containing protein [Saprospiraceae bacterium]|nr:DUF262 domain-containing protein [Saprospiraceae bacterium]
MEVKFTPEHKVVNDLFAREIKYIIPAYQRPYSWDCEGKSDKNNQVNSMWDDLYGYFLDGKRETYFFGSMVLIGNGNRIYQVVDGQQRLTTLVLLFAAFKCFVQEAKGDYLSGTDYADFPRQVVLYIDELIFDKKLHGAVPFEKKVKIEKTGDFDFDAVLNQAIECKSFTKESYPYAKPEQLSVAERYFKNKDYFVEKLQKHFLTEGHFTEQDAERLNNFLDFIKNKVSVVRILTDNFEIAYHIFEILNNRGLPLSNKDLFRNFILREFDALKNEGGQYANISPTDKWDALERDYDLRDDFLPRWVESVNARQQQYSAFNDLKEIYDKHYRDRPGKKRIEILYSDIERDLMHYTAIVNAEVKNPLLRAKLNVLLNAGNARYTLNFLLALWRHFEGNEDAVYSLVNAYEIFLLHKLLVGRFVSGSVYGAISNLSKDDAQSSIIAVLSPVEIKNRLAEVIRTGKIDNDAGKLLISKWVWLQEANTKDDLIDQNLYFDRATLEHIIPQTPDINSNWLHDFSAEFRAEYTYKLGNMTLLTGSKNSAARNYDFSIYAKTKLSVTQQMSGLDKIDETYIKSRNNLIVTALLSDLGLDAYPMKPFKDAGYF